MPDMSLSALIANKEYVSDTPQASGPSEPTASLPVAVNSNKATNASGNWLTNIKKSEDPFIVKGVNTASFLSQGAMTELSDRKEEFTNKEGKKMVWGAAGKGAMTGATIGATAGMYIPVVGSVIGAVVGAVVGAIAGAITGLFKKKKAKKDAREVRARNDILRTQTSQEITRNQLGARQNEIIVNSRQLSEATPNTTISGYSSNPSTFYRGGVLYR
jgi:uncharacterized membrane protein